MTTTIYTIIFSDFNYRDVMRYKDEQQIERVLHFTSIKKLAAYIETRTKSSIGSYSNFCKELRTTNCTHGYGRNEEFIVLKQKVNPQWDWQKFKNNYDN